MKTPTPQHPGDSSDEIAALIETLHSTGKRLEQLTAGEVDGVADQDGRTFLLRHAQEHLRDSEAARQAAILDALPAHIALLDVRGNIISVNQEWRKFACANALQGPPYAIGANYLEVCDNAQGDDAAEAAQVAAGIRAVLAGESREFSFEYSCHAPTQQRWFLMTVTPLAEEFPHGVVVMHLDITRRMKADQLFRDLLEASPDAMVIVDREGKIALVNLQTINLFGWPREALLGQAIEMLLPQRNRGSHPRERSAYFSQPRTRPMGTGLEQHGRHRDGREFPIEISLSPLETGEGSLAIASIRDITERKRHEQEILATKTQLQGMLDALPDLLFELGLDGLYYACHSPRRELLAAPTEELIGKRVGEVLPADAADTVLSALREADTTGYSTGKQFKLALPQGILWFELSVARMAMAGGQEPRFICLSRDITGRKAAEARIIYLNRVYAVQSGINALIVRVRDRDQLFEEACRVVVDLGGFRMAMIGIVNRDEMKIVPVAAMGKDEALLDAIRNILSSVELASNTMVARSIRENRIIISNDSQNDPQVMFGKQYAEAGVNSIIVLPLILAKEVSGVFAIYASESNFFHDQEVTLLSELAGDISFAMDYLKAQEALHSLYEELEVKVALRTVDLEQARIEAERANAAKSTFLATMSHEIRTPMNGVIGMIDVLQQSSLNGPQMEMSNVIRDSAYALLAVINDILDFSKIEAGKLEIERVPMCVAEVVEKTCEIMDRMAQKSGVELSLFTDPAIPEEVMGDPGRLRQILLNLANNAIKFSSGKERSGRVSIRALLAESHAEHVTLEFRIADNGIGIDKATRARLFSPFIQADASTTRNYGGTGLGLAISRQLANMMHGEIAVQSAPGEGSLFSVRIPFAVPTEGRTPARNLSRSGKYDPDTELVAGLTCLVVGCQDGIAGDLATYLEYGNAVVERASDLPTAEKWIASHSSGRAIVVIDARFAKSSRDELIATARMFQESDIHFVVIGRGLRQDPRVEADDLVSVDANAFTRRTLLNAVAIAAGRVPAQRQQVLRDESSVPGMQLSSETIRRRGSRILVAEDNAINQNVILHQLALLDYSAEVADDGRAALIRWRQGNFALLLTDLHMPKMDGYELTAAIRSAEGKGERLPIIALTANALKSEEMRCKEAGMDAYLSKPVLLDQLQAMLEIWLPIPGSEETRGDAPAPTASPRLAVLDRAVLPKQIGNDPALVAQFFQDYRRSAQDAAVEIRTALAAGNWKAASDGAHKLKSSSRAVGALALGDICARLELAGKDADAGAALAFGPEFEKALEAVVAAIDHEEN